MTNHKTTYTLEINAEISALRSELENAKKAMKALDGSNFATGVEKKIGLMIAAIDKLQKKASQPIDSKAAFTSLEKGFGSIVVDAKNLLGELEKIQTLTTKDKLSLLPENEAKKLKEAISAVQAYQKAVDKAERKRVRDLETAKITKTDTQGKLSTAKKSASSAKTALENATKKGTQYGDALAIIQQAEAAKKARKEIASLEKQLKGYREKLEELKKLENRTPEQESNLQTIRGNINSISGKIGNRTKIVNKAPDEKTLTAANKVVEENTPSINVLEQAVTAADQEVNRLTNTIEKLNQKIADNSLEITESQADYKVLYEQAKKLGISLEGVTEDVNPSNITLLTNRLTEMINKGIQPVDDAVAGATPAIKELGNTAQEAGDKTRYAGESFAAMTDNTKQINNLKSTIAQFVGWTGAAKALSAALRNAFQKTKELDKAMTEISVVTDFEVGDMWDQLPEYTERANNLGIAITETYEASALFYQQGLKTNEMVELSNETLKMARIAGLDASEATDRMTAALRGFNMELDQASAQKVSDVYSQLAAITASDVNEISSAMTKTASIASSAGMEFETTAAFLSQIIETTRESAETAGTAMKTVIARFQELKKSPDEIGEIEGEIVDANQIETALRSVGVSLRDAGGQFRELDEVFLELSSKWDGLDKNTQRYIATIAAGSRQQSRFIAMMQDYERTQELVAAANNSAGASQKQYEKTMDSLETKLTRLENAWTEFSTGLMNSDLVKFAVDFLTNLLNALNKVTEGFNSFTSSLSKIGTLVAIFQMAKVVVGKFFDNIITKIYTSAHEAGRQIAQGTQDGINSAGQVKTTPTQDNKTTGVKQALLQKVPGYTQISEGINHIKQSKDQVIAAKNKKREMSYELAGFEQESRVKVQKTKKAEESQKSKVAELKNQAPAKGSKERKKQQQELKKEEKELLKLTEERKAAEQELQDVQNENSKELAEADKKIAEAEKNSQAARKEGFNTICDGAQKAAQSLTMLGVGIGMVGQLFNSLGMEKVGAVFQNVGNIVTTVGSAFMAIIPMVKLLGNTFTIQGGKIAIAGTTAQLAWWWVLIIVAAVAMLIAITAIAIKKANENSPEGKLKKAKEAADAAAESANQAAEAYDNLKNSLEELDTGYNELENLTEGTEEWYEAVKKLNGQVLTLIQNYPELAKYLTQKNGVLQLNTSGEGVQNVLSGLENNKVWTANAVLSANMEVREKEADLTYSNLNRTVRRYLTEEEQSLVTNYNTDKANMERLGENAQLILTPEEYQKAEKLINHTSLSFEDTTKALGKALASGDIVDAEYGLKSTLSDEELEEKYGFDSSSFGQFYTQLNKDTEALMSLGKQLNKNKDQANASYEAMATAAEEMANLAGLTTDQQKQAKNLTDGSTYEAIEKEVDSKLDELNMSRKDGEGGSRDAGFYDHMTDEEKEAFNQALKNVYHDNEVTYDRESGKVTYTDADGNQQKEELHEREGKIKTQMKSIISSNRLAEHTEAAPRAIEILNEVTGTEAFSQMFQEANGGALTKGALSQIKGEDGILNEEEITNYWEKLGEEGQKAFANFDDFKEKMVSITDTADNSFANAENIAKTIFGEDNDLVKEFMTAGMAEGFANKIEEVYKISGEEGAQQVKDAYETLISGQTDEVASKITALMNSVDWTNQESLLSFQIALEEQYGYTRDEAKSLTDSMAEATKATSSLRTTVEVFGAFYHATQKLNAALQKTADLQWEYERMLKKGASATKLAANIEEQRQSILAQGAAALDAYEKARQDQHIAYASGVNLDGVNKDLTQYVKFDTNTGQYNLTELQRQINAGEFGKEGSDSRKAVEDYISKLEEANSLAQDQLDAAKDSYEQLEELNEQAEEGYANLYDQIGSLLISEIEKEIDTQQDILDATESANDKLLSKMQEQIDADRQERENDKTEKNLSDLYNQRAILMASGGSASEIASLDQQIMEAEESYQDTLVDQALQNLQDANDKAAEQRERQIELQESSLEAYQQSAQYQNDIQTMLNDYMVEYQAAKEENKDFDIKNTELGAALIEAGFLRGLNDLEQADFWSTLTTNTAQASQYLNQVDANTAGNGKLTMADILSKIEANTAAENLATQRTQSDAAAAREKDIGFYEATGFDISGTGTRESFTGEDGKYDTEAANDYVSNVSSMATTTNQNKLVEGNAWASNFHSMVNGNSAVSDNQLLSQTDFYQKINSGKTVTMGGKNFTKQGIEDWLLGKEGATDQSYKAYMEAYQADNTTKAQSSFNTNMEYLKTGQTSYDHVGNAMKQALVITGAAQSLSDADQQIKKQLAKDFGWGIDGTFKVQQSKKWKNNEVGNLDMKIGDHDDPDVRHSGNKASGQVLTALDNLAKMSGDKNIVYIHGDPGQLWVRHNDKWASVKNQKSENRPKGLANAAEAQIKNLFGFKTGGLADFTGPAWLDGTPSRPEYILNAKQTERFFSLIDVLEGYDTDKNKKSTSGDNYFDIDINVEKIEDDYDIEQIADKIRRMIYDDATYRNVNTINHIR